MEYVILAAAIALFMVLYMIRCVSDEKRRKKRFRESLYSDYGKVANKKYPEGRMEKISSHYRKKSAAEKEKFFIDDITWNDLELDRLFQRIDYTFSATGEEMLYTMLRFPSDSEEELLKRENLIRYFMEHTDDRVALQFLFAQIGRTGKYSIYEYMDYLDNLGARKNTKHYVVLGAMFVSLLGCFIDVGYGLLAFALLLCYNLVTYFKEKSDIDPYITTFSYIFRVLDMEKKFRQCKIDVISEMVDEMDRRRKKFRKFSRFSSLLMYQNTLSGNPLDILLDYIRMGFHLNLIKFNTMLSECRKYKEDIVFIIETMGYIECMISIGAYRASLHEYSEPGFERPEGSMAADRIYHPLLAQPVANSFEIKKGMLLTGSNASGKSTFLKTIAVAQIMAQSIHTVCAKQYNTSFYRMFTSMALRDDLAGSDSYFIVEIKALKRIIDASETMQMPIMCFVDEVLRGTNTVERIAAASEILMNLAESGVFCFAATHDIELTLLLETQYSNYHFEETIEDHDVKFNYLLGEGRATSRNAIKLLSVLGYEAGIIKKAEKRANGFLKTGEWK